MEQIRIDGMECRLFVKGTPEVLLVQPSARHEDKNDGIQREVALIEKASSCGFAIVFFDCREWARALMPWADDAVSHDSEVGRHAADTLHFVEHSLLPWLRGLYGRKPCILGGYSLGGLFALWAARNSTAFAAFAAASPSLWIRGWGEYAAAHPVLGYEYAVDDSLLQGMICKKSTSNNSTFNTPHSIFYLSLGDREEHCRNQRMKRIGDCARAEYALLSQHNTVVLKWHSGGHFGAEAERTAEAFAWCVAEVLKKSGRG